MKLPLLRAFATLLSLVFFLKAYSLPGNFLGASPSSALYEYVVTVVDESKSPLPGVNVYTDDHSFVATTDEAGKVTLVDIEYSTLINFSFVGYKQVRLPFYEIRQAGGMVVLTKSLDLLPTVTVIGRRDEKPQEIPYQIGTVDKREIAFFNAQTTADALGQNENVFIQKSQMGGGSINIRGFEANKVLLVVDGVRMNNIIFRNGHLQDAIKVDNSVLEQIEVLYGPGSLNYGSDALGGVVHFRTRDPQLLSADAGGAYDIQTNAMVRFASANQEKTAHLDLNYGTEKWGSLTSFSFADFDDLRAGANRPDAYPDFGSRERYVVRGDKQDDLFFTRDTNVQSPTGYSQFDFLQKIKFQPNKNQYFLLNFQYSTTSNVPRYDFLTDTNAAGQFVFSEWYYGPQQRLLASLKSQTFKKTALFDKFTIIGAMQKIDEDRYERLFLKAWRQYTLEDVYAFSLTADFDKRLGEQAVLTYGLDNNLDLLFSSAGQVNVETEERASGVMTRYPSGGSDLTTLAAYTNYRWQSSDSVLTMFAGLRYTWTRLFAIYEERADDPFRFAPIFYNQGSETVNSKLTWSGGLTIQTPGGWQFKAIGSSAFHAPNVDDFAKFRVRNFFFRVPNPDLKPESSVNGEITIGKEFGTVQRRQGVNALISATGYYTFLKDAIVEQNYFINNNPSDTLIVNEANGFEYRVRANVNAEQGSIVGGNLNFLLTLGKSWQIESSAGYSWGRLLEDGEEKGPIDHIPPLFGRALLTYQSGKLRASYVYRFQAAKPAAEYGGGEDNLNYATPDGTYAWSTHNLYVSWKFAKKFSLDVSLENILDFHYRPFSSGVSAAGRNLIVALRGSF